MKISNGGKTLVKALLSNPVKFAKLVGFDLLTDMHNEWIVQMVTAKEDCTLLGHRGSYKTTCLSFAFALLIVLRPNKTIFFIRKTDNDVIEIITQTRKILESDLFAYIVKTIYNVDFSITIASASKISTNLATGTKGQVQLLGLGLGGSLTGKHADYIFTDDIVNIKDRVSKAEREFTKTQYQELQNIKNRGGRIMNTGTPWHSDDAISTLMPNVTKYDCYNTGLIDSKTLYELKQSMTPSLFAANYELRHIAEADTLFSNPKFATCDDMTLLNGGILHVDARYNGKDYTAVTLMKRVNNDKYIALGKLFDKHVEDCLADILDLSQQYDIKLNICETNGDKGYLARNLAHLGLKTKGYFESMNKHLKITTYLLHDWKNIYWLPNTDGDYISMITDYNDHAAHDDAPDSAASLLRHINECDVKLNINNYLKGGY